MNIFYVDSDPIIAAQSLGNRHVVKMIVESAQMLSTAHRVLDGKDHVLGDSREDVLYKCTHKNHPSAVWCRSSVENYSWLVEHFFGLMQEYTHRYDKKHKCAGDLSFMIQSPPYNLKDWDFTEPPACMPDEYKISSNVIENYRNYYRVGKAKLHQYKNREAPIWIS